MEQVAGEHKGKIEEGIIIANGVRQDCVLSLIRSAERLDSVRSHT